MRQEYTDMNVDNTGDGALGTPMIVEQFTNKTVQFHGTMAGMSLQLQGTVGVHADWCDIGAAVNTPSIVEISASLTKLRVKTVTHAGGQSPVVTFAGQDLRSH